MKLEFGVVGNKRKHPEEFDRLIMFKKPEDKKQAVTSTLALMKRVKYDEDKPKEAPKANALSLLA